MFGKKTGVAHEWIPSNLGHGDLMCENCCVTSAEARVLGLINDCQAQVFLRQTQDGRPLDSAEGE